MKTTSLTILATLLLLAALPACQSPEETEPDVEAPRITLADAPEILNLSSLLPPGFAQEDPELRGPSKEDLGLGADASEVQVYRADSPFQTVYCFLRIIEDQEERRRTDLAIYDEDGTRRLMNTYLDAVAASSRGGVFIEPDIHISYPEVGTGAVLAQGGISFDDTAVTFDMLLFRSTASRVYVSVHSWYVSPPRVSVTEIARKIEQRIEGFGR
jgi:hypothetical protein